MTGAAGIAEGARRDTSEPRQRGAPEREPPLTDETQPVTGKNQTAARAQSELERMMAGPLQAGLYLVATPIGNLGDITLRALSVLARADVIYCEDTRHSLTLTAHYGITTHLKPYHEHNGARERPKILEALRDQRSIALISDAGTPLISDPGYKLVREAITAGHKVESLPGASAALTALTVSGLPTNAFHFAGFLPVRSASRRTRIGELSGIASTLVLFEAPGRVAEALADLAAVLGPRQGAVARELTKRFETIERGTLSELAGRFSAGGEVKGEIVVLVGPPVAVDVSDEAIKGAMAAALETMSLRDAARAVAEEMGVPKSRVYDIGVKLN